jgi:hypothetical protein
VTRRKISTEIPPNHPAIERKGFSGHWSPLPSNQLVDLASIRPAVNDVFALAMDKRDVTDELADHRSKAKSLYVADKQASDPFASICHISFTQDKICWLLAGGFKGPVRAQRR